MGELGSGRRNRREVGVMVVVASIMVQKSRAPT